MLSYILIPNGDLVTSAFRAESISRELFRITRPVPQDGDVSALLCSWISHPTSGQCALVCDLQYPVPVAANASFELLLDALLDTSAESAQRHHWRELLQGFLSSTASVADILQDLFVVATYEELEAQGWFEGEEI